MKDGKADFVPVKTGIAGERYLEVLTGLKDGDQVITGPFDSVRGMYEGDMVNTDPPAGAASTGAADGSRTRRCRRSSSPSGWRWRRSGPTSSDRC